MKYYCDTCGHPLTIPSSAAWPSCCPYCGAMPLSARLGNVRTSYLVPAWPARGGAAIEQASAIAGELLERASDAGRSAAA